MFYTIYKITNKINGKIYIGKHQTKDLNDGYMGSGKKLRNSIIKYGIDNFEKEVLFKFDNEDEMNSKEAEVVTEEFCLREDTYNLCIGGNGGWNYVNTNVVTKDILMERSKTGRKKADESIIVKHGSLKYLLDKIAIAGPASVKDKYKNDPVYREKHQKNLEEARKLTQTESAIAKRKATYDRIGYSKGNKNSQFGTMWITNNKENKKIKKEDVIPDGWYKGRKL